MCYTTLRWRYGSSNISTTPCSLAGSSGSSWFDTQMCFRWGECAILVDITADRVCFNCWKPHWWLIVKPWSKKNKQAPVKLWMCSCCSAVCICKWLASDSQVDNSSTLHLHFICAAHQFDRLTYTASSALQLLAAAPTATVSMRQWWCFGH